MFYAVFAGGGVNLKFQKTVCRILKSAIDINCISDTALSGGKNDFTAIFIKRPKKIALTPSVLILNRADGIANIKTSLCICDADIKEDAKCAEKCQSKAITCGFSQFSTVTFSSITDESCVINVQRTLKRFDGSDVEPFELPIKCKKEDDKYAVLCAHLVLILLGKI